MTESNHNLIEQIHVTLKTLLSKQGTDVNAFSENEHQDLKDLAEILSESGNSQGQQGDDSAFTPTLSYNLDDSLQHLLALMAANRLTSKQRLQLVEKLDKNPDVLKTVVKSAQKGMAGANGLLEHAQNTLSSDRLNKINSQINRISPGLKVESSSSYRRPNPFDISQGPKPYKE